MNRLGLAVLAAACLASGGCARLLQALLSPQSAVTSTVGQVADSAVSSGLRSDVGSMSSEVDRLIAAGYGDSAELMRISGALGQRGGGGRRGSAQSDPSRRTPWDPRVAERPLAPDWLVTAYRRGEPLPRGIATSSQIPDGTGVGLPGPSISLGPVRR